MSAKPAIHLCVINPPGYIHADGLMDPAQYFFYQFRRLGARVSLARNTLRHDAVNFIFGAHLGFDVQALQTHSCIIVNLEQVGQGGAVLSQSYLRLLKSTVVVDYDAGNPPAYTQHPEDVPLISFGHAPYLQPLPHQALPLHERPVDLLFIGSINQRRLDLIRRIQATGRRVECQRMPVYGTARNSLLHQAKALLNLHFYDTARFEQVRAFTSLSCGTPVLSERHANSSPSPAYDACVTWFDDRLIEPLFGEEFGTPFFYEVMTQQLAMFAEHDPVEEYADLLGFAWGVWQAQQSVLKPTGQDRMIGPRMTLPLAPEISESMLIPGISLSEDDWTQKALRGPAARTKPGTKPVGVREAGWVDAFVPTEKMPAPLFQPMPDICHAVNQLVAADQGNEAIASLVHGIATHYFQPGIDCHALYYPDLDRCVQTLSQHLEAEIQQEAQQQKSDGEISLKTGAPLRTILIATSVAPVGGHGKLLEEVALHAPNPLVVFSNLSSEFDDDEAEATRTIRERFAARGIEVSFLRAPNAWGLAQQLRKLVEAEKATHIWYFQNHQDPIPLVGTLGHAQSRKILVHHCDHNPSLGCTLPGVVQAEVTDLMLEIRKTHLDAPGHLLPLSVADRGRKPQEAGATGRLSVVMAGRQGKFTDTGPLALQKIISTALRSIDGQFYHIGPLSGDMLNAIRNQLVRDKVKPGRFVHVGTVASAWLALKTLDAQVYIGSAPASGGLSSVEAQGCGYPVLPFTGFEAGSLLADYSSYADLGLGWKDLDELAAQLKAIGPRCAELSDTARRFYEENFSEAVFQARIRQIMGIPGSEGGSPDGRVRGESSALMTTA
ncbi:MAG: hypothetical protein Q4D19_09605 [Lautropia sp.]|nr:hypothetical protein [Lautropia sp.]